MKRVKRLLALLLVLATVLSIFPLQSLAAEVEEVSQEPETAETAELSSEEGPKDPSEDEEEMPTEQQPEEPSQDQAEVPAEEHPEEPSQDQVETPVEETSVPEEEPADGSAPARQAARISSDAEVVADGTSGDVSWTLYDDGTLVIGETITGSGKMADYPRSNARPWWRINNVVYLQQITSVIVKEGVTSIGDYAFFYMQKLTNLELPDSITSIGDSAFGTCRSLTSVVIPEKVTSIGNDAFNFAENLTDVVIPTSLTNIGKDAFANTAWQKNQGDFPVINGILVGYEGEGGVVTIPENVTAINTGAFAWCSSSYGNSNVTEIIIPDTVKSIGTDAFCYCTNLTTAVLSGSVTAIPERMFQSCVSLTSVTIPEGVTSIEKSAFECCSSLTRIDLPDGVTTIGNDAFSWCESLTQITIPASVTKIGGDAFDSVSTDLVIIGDVDSYAQQFATDRGFQFRCYMPLGTVELSKTVYTYSGEPCTPDATVRDSEGNLLEEGVDYVVTYSDNIDAGTATATVTGIGPYQGTITATYSIQSAAQVLVVTPSAVTVGMGETVQLNVTGFGALHFSVNQPNVATVDANGQVKGLTVGSAVITVKADGDRNHRAAVTTVPVSVILATPKITGIGNQLNGVAIVWGKVAGAAKYRVFRKLPNGWLTLGDTTGLTFTDTTAQSGQTYTYVVRCVSANGKSFTSAYDPTGRTIQYLAPPAISKVECALKGVQVTWGKVPGAVKYRVFRKLPSGGWQPLGDTTGLTFTDTTAQSGQTYTYVVRCVSADGKSFTSAYDPTGRTLQYLAAPAVSRVTCTLTGVQVTWGKVPGAVKYRVFRNLPTGGWQPLGDTTGLTFTDTTAQSGQTYTYVVRCISANGRTFTSAYDPAGRTIQYLAAPAVSRLDCVQTGVQVTWGKVAGAVKYRVFRKLPNGWLTLGDTTGLTFTDTTAQSGQTYTYVVRCVSADGKSFTSAYDPTGRTIQYLAPPVISRVDCVLKGVQVTWGKVPGAVKYRVFRKLPTGGWLTLGDTTGLTFTDTTAQSGQTYTYVVRCVSANGKSFTSAYIPTGRSIYYLSAPVVSGVESIQTGVKVTWGRVPGAVKYRVFRNLPSGSWQPLGDTTALTFVDTAVQSGQTFTYVVRCISADGKAFTSAYDPAGRTITFLSVPQIKSATNVAGGVNVQWAPVKGAVRYCVFRKSGSEGWKAVGTATGTSFTDTTVPRQSVQTYTVRCVSADGKRFTSAYDSAGVTISVPTYTTPNSYSFSQPYRSGIFYQNLMSVRVGGDQRAAILAVAQSQLGYTEGNNSSGTGGDTKGEKNFTEFGYWYYHHIDSSDLFYQGAWCSMFASWCANEAGIPESVIPRIALVAYMKDAFEGMGRYYTWTKSQCGGGKQAIRPGDLIIFSSAPLGRLNHIGLVLDVTYKSGKVTIKTVEGNKNDQCCIKTYTLSTSSLTGYDTKEEIYIRGFACPAYNA